MFAAVDSALASSATNAAPRHEASLWRPISGNQHELGYQEKNITGTAFAGRPLRTGSELRLRKSLSFMSFDASLNFFDRDFFVDSDDVDGLLTTSEEVGCSMAD